MVIYMPTIACWQSGLSLAPVDSVGNVPNRPLSRDLEPMRYIPILLALVFAAPSLARAQAPALPPNQLPADGLPPPTEQEGVETLTRGPIHEAFANPADPDPEPSPVVPKKPPQDVPEQPPE